MAVVPEWRVYHFGVTLDDGSYHQIEMLMTEKGRDKYLRQHKNAVLLAWDGTDWTVPIVEAEPPPDDTPPPDVPPPGNGG